ncbi:MAG: hypothetical protein LH477_09445, partial [Nocardioides sp.]|nr:hypothetical protein [Nocardioides sp.]
WVGGRGPVANWIPGSKHGSTVLCHPHRSDVSSAAAYVAWARTLKLLRTAVVSVLAYGFTFSLFYAGLGAGVVAVT